MTEALVENLLQIIETQAVLGSAVFDLDAFLELAVQKMQTMTAATGAVVELVDGDSLEYRAASGTAAEFTGLRVLRSKSLSGLCVSDNEIKISNDTSSDPRVDGVACAKVGAASMVCVPLLRKGEVVGVLKVLSSQKNAFQEDAMQKLKLMAGLLGGALGQQLEIAERAELESKLRHAALHDELTGLPNRTLFYDRLCHAIRRSVRNRTTLALLYLDIDHFKSINDTQGHLVGDKLLHEFAKRIKTLIRGSDTFARLGGDEFTIILEEVKNTSQVDTVASKVVAAANEDFDLGDRVISVSSSVGIALSETACVDPDQLIRLADGALYQAKKEGRNKFVYSDTVITGWCGF
ncbi:MAG TPA: sensor domain-containing diguanylate cyclase [Drouetiella sp.]